MDSGFTQEELDTRSVLSTSCALKRQFGWGICPTLVTSSLAKKSLLFPPLAPLNHDSTWMLQKNCCNSSTPPSSSTKPALLMGSSVEQMLAVPSRKTQTDIFHCLLTVKRQTATPGSWRPNASSAGGDGSYVCNNDKLIPGQSLLGRW